MKIRLNKPRIERIERISILRARVSVWASKKFQDSFDELLKVAEVVGHGGV
jgi:hypothetical protein